MTNNVRTIGAIDDLTLRRSKQRAYALFAAVMGLLLGSAIVSTLLTNRRPDLGLLALFGCLMFVTENRDRVFSDETSVSASIVVGIASIFAFQGSAQFFGPLLTASLAGFYLPHLRQLDLPKIVINSSSIGLSALSGAVVLSLV